MKKVLATILSLILVFTIIPATALNASAYTSSGPATNDYTTWKQTNTQWAEATPWPNASIPKFGDAGCWITSIAILLRHYNVVTDSNVNTFNPLICNNRLMSYGIVDSAGDWTSAGLANMNKAYLGFTYAGTKYTSSISDIVSLYQSGYACVVHETKGHYVAVRSASGSSVVVMDPGSSTTSLSAFNYIMYFKASSSPTPTNKVAQGDINSVTGQTGAIHVRGWAFDGDNTSKAIPVHVYIGSKCYIISANKYRPDVNNVYKVGDYHGFEDTIYTDLSGSQTVKIYAIGINKSGGSDNNNPLLKNSGAGGKYSHTVTIIKDSTKPTISDIKVTNVSAEGYTVSCTVTDNVAVDRVQFPTWTAYAGQDDILKDWETNAKAKGAISGNTVTFNVKNTDHNGEIGTYITDIYAYDKAGNVASIRSSVTLRDYISLAGQKEYNGRKYELYNAATNCDSAKEYAEEKGGHLVTITSAAENNAVADLIKQYGTKNLYWMGAFDKNKNKSFEWVTGEAFSYTNWAVNDPSVNDNTQQYLQISSMDNPGSTQKKAYTWTDEHNTGGTDFYALGNSGFIIEYENYQPNGQKIYNGNKYELYNEQMSWKTAKVYAEKKGGHLVTITSAAENNAVADLIKQYGTKNLYWMGAFDKNKNKSFEWVTGEAFSYTNWAVNDPSVNDNTQQYLQISSMDNPGSTQKKAYTWTDEHNTGGTDFYALSNTGFIIEYEDVRTPISDCTISLSYTTTTYSTTAKTPTVTVKNGTKTLTQNNDYTVTYKNNVNAGTATVTITGIGLYCESVNKTFTINKRSFNDWKENTEIVEVVYPASNIKTYWYMSWGDYKLVEGKDYTVSVEGEIKAGNTVKIIYTGINNFKDTHSLLFKITCDSHNYGNWIVTKQAKCEESGEKYRVCTVCGNKETASIPAKGHGDVYSVITDQPDYFYGCEKEWYCKDCGEYIYTTWSDKKLKLKTPKFTLKSSKKSFKVKYTKVKDATGFQIRYKTGKSKWNVKTFYTKKTVTKTIKKLKKGKKYTVQIRAFVNDGDYYRNQIGFYGNNKDNNAYSSWTKAKKVTVK